MTAAIYINGQYSHKTNFHLRGMDCYTGTGTYTHKDGKWLHITLPSHELRFESGSVAVFPLKDQQRKISEPHSKDYIFN